MLISHMQRTVTHFPPKAAASVRHSGVSSIRSRSADAGKTIVVLLLLFFPLPWDLGCMQPIFASVTQSFLTLVHISVAFIGAPNVIGVSLHG